MPTSRRLRQALPLLALLALAAGAASARGADSPATERWYDIRARGQKTGHLRVVWAPSTWEGNKTVHDTTTVVQAQVRDMLGTRDTFSTRQTIDIERGEDGTLWWQRVIMEEAGRRITEELTWTGSGYAHVARGEGQVKTMEIALEKPVHVDGEAFLSAGVREGTLAVGQKFTYAQLDLGARGARTFEIEVLSREEMTAEEGPIATWKVRERDSVSGALTHMWIDDAGAAVRWVDDAGTEVSRVGREDAEAAPVRPARLLITTPSAPVLERVMAADRMLLDLHLQPDSLRALPDLPDSPWSRVRSVDGNDERGWVLHLELNRHDDPSATTTLPLEEARREAFARALEGTVLMPVDHPAVQAAVREAVGEEKDARTVAARLARWVFRNLEKRSPKVSQASALQILQDRCGDCSEHALLYVTLCRAAGIPTRACSGYVSVGSHWGAHAWAEVWLGSWVGADPTTGELGCGARYVFFGYDDHPGHHPGLVSARITGRARFVVREIEEAGQRWDLSDASRWHQRIETAGGGVRHVHVLAGLEIRDPPEGWDVVLIGDERIQVRAEGLRADIRVSADQGARLEDMGGAEGTWAGLPSRRPTSGLTILHWRRRMIGVDVKASSPELRTAFEALMRASFVEGAVTPRADASEDREAEEATEPVPAR